jgi:hypothetical protein
MAAIRSSGVLLSQYARSSFIDESFLKSSFFATFSSILILPAPFIDILSHIAERRAYREPDIRAIQWNHWQTLDKRVNSGVGLPISGEKSPVRRPCY